MKVNFQGATKTQTILLLYKFYYYIKLFATGKNEGLAILW